MKKHILILTSLTLATVMMIGCAKTTTAISTSKELNKHLNLLSNTIERLDTIDNQYLVNSDIYTLNKSTSVPSPYNTDKVTIASINKLADDNDDYININSTEIESYEDNEIEEDSQIVDTANDTLDYNNKNNTQLNLDNINQSTIDNENQNDIPEGKTISLQEDLRQALTNEIINRLYCDNNGNCKICGEKFVCDNDGICNSCNKTVICDNDGNCNSCGKQLLINNNNCCSNCNTSCISNHCNDCISNETLNNLKQISSNNQNKLVADQLTELSYINDNNNIDNKQNNEDYNNTTSLDAPIDSNQYTNQTNKLANESNIYGTKEKEINTEANTNPYEENNIDNVNTESTIYNDTDNQNTNLGIDETITQPLVELTDETLDVTTLNNEDNNPMDNYYDGNEYNPTSDINYEDKEDNEINTPYNYYYYREEHFNPEFLKYQPRFISTIDYSMANSNIERYIDKLQKLYTMTADVVEANNELTNYKIIILDDIDEAKNLNGYILSGTYTPNSSQVSALNNYIEDIKTTIKNLRNCNGNLTNEINKISSTNTGIVQSIDVTNSNYVRILNQIDTRISFHENAIATLEQIKYILLDTQNNNNDNSSINPIFDGTQNYETYENNNPTSPITQDEFINNDLNVYEHQNNIGINNENTQSSIENSTTNTDINPDTNINNNESNLNNNYLNDNYTNSNNDNQYYNSLNYNNVNNDNNFPNGVISQNNLDTNTIGNSTYRYDNDGNLYNATNGYNSNNINNVNNKNNNVNTYKYNTLIDSINRGTIDNGINNL